jgi:microcin C transport system permease protein
MLSYIACRLILMLPTLLGILLINFAIVQAAPGGPVEQLVAQLTSADASSASSRISGPSTDFGATTSGALQGSTQGAYRGAQGFDFGTSFFRDRAVIDLLLEKLPVSISLGLWTTLLVYLISIPLGIRKAVHDGSAFDVWTSTIIVIGQAIPAFLFAVLLLILFAGGSYFQWFPLRGLTSEGFDEMGTFAQISDYFWHLTLPILAMVIGGFASLTLLTKNSFIEELGKQYILTARAKGLTANRVLYGHVFRNAMLIVIAGLPSALLSILFTSSLLIEVIFSLDGLGLLGFEAAISRDYPVMFGTLFLFSLLGLVFKLIGDLIYMLVDPRIDFERRAG